MLLDELKAKIVSVKTMLKELVVADELTESEAIRIGEIIIECILKGEFIEDDV